MNWNKSLRAQAKGRSHIKEIWALEPTLAKNLHCEMKIAKINFRRSAKPAGSARRSTKPLIMKNLTRTKSNDIALKFFGMVK